LDVRSVVERVDIAHRAEGTAPSFAKVFQINPIDAATKKQASAKRCNVKILLKLFKQSLKVQSICGNILATVFALCRHWFLATAFVRR
jgi:hypothetical protein